MGLRFRKSVSLFPGVKLNFGTTGTGVQQSFARLYLQCMHPRCA